LLTGSPHGWPTKSRSTSTAEDKAEQKFWQGVRQSPARTTRDIRSRFREIDRRLADMETFYVSNNKQFADEIESLR
jgi:phage shock protein C